MGRDVRQGTAVAVKRVEEHEPRVSRRAAHLSGRCGLASRSGYSKSVRNLLGLAQEASQSTLVLEQSRSSPVTLSTFALEQVAFAVIDGSGPLAAARSSVAGIVEKHEVDLLRRILHAFGGDRNIDVTQAEAETLFRINDGTCEEMNHPSWNLRTAPSAA